MSAPHPELYILVVALVALALAPLASRLVSQVGERISGEMGDGPATPEESLADEIRQVVTASNQRRARAGEPLLDVEAEVERILREHD